MNVITVNLRDWKKKKYKTHTLDSADIYPPGYEWFMASPVNEVINESR